MKHYDYIIVGAGPAGCLLANRLVTGKGARVLLLEAGPEDRGMFFRMPAGFLKYYTTNSFYWPYRAEQEEQLGGKAARLQNGKVLGGGSSVNAMVYIRGNPRDFDAWAAMTGEAAWNGENAWATYRGLERNSLFGAPHHGVRGPLHVSPQAHTNELTLAFVAAAQEAGLPFNPDFNGDRQTGVGLYQLTTRTHRRWSAVDAFIHPILGNPDFDLVTGAEVERILLAGTRAVGVRYKKDGEVVEQRCDEEVILSAGAIASPKLLMLSGIGPAEAVARHAIEPVVDLPGVGANFIDHCEVPVAAYTRKRLGYYGVDKGMRSWLAGLQYLLFKTGPVASNGVEGGGFFHTDGEDADPNIQIFAVPGIYLDKDVTDISPGAGITLNACLVQPKSRGRVTLRSADPSDLPHIVTGFLSHQDDLDTMIKGVRRLREVFSCEPLKSLLSREVLPGTDVQDHDGLVAHIKRFVKTVYHPMGTCRMGRADDPMAVVDPRLAVRGTEGLRVVDASVMPSPVSGNTVAATYMVAETAAKFILPQKAY